MSNMLKPIEIPDGVDATVKGSTASLRGPKGELQHEVPMELNVELNSEKNEIKVVSESNDRSVKAIHGLHRSLLANKIQGVSEGYEKKIEIHGTGYNVKLQGKKLVLQVGFCHDVTFELPDIVEVEIEQNAAQPDNPAKFTVRSIDKENLGQFCADVRSVRPPEPYKGKGIRYADEHVRRKEGKAFAGLE